MPSRSLSIVWLQSLSQQPPYLLKHNNVSDTCLMITYLIWQKSKYLSLEIKIFTPSYPNLFLISNPFSYPQGPTHRMYSVPPKDASENLQGL